MSNRSDNDLLVDILEAARRTMEYCAGLSCEDFLTDTKTQDAVVRNIEIIGEASKGLSGELKERYAGVPWKNITGMRDKLIHHYFGVNLDIVWDVVTRDLPDLMEKIRQIPGGDTQ